MLKIVYVSWFVGKYLLFSVTFKDKASNRNFLKGISIVTLYDR